jgi:hypothetical protein
MSVYLDLFPAIHIQNKTAKGTQDKITEAKKVVQELKRQREEFHGDFPVYFKEKDGGLKDLKAHERKLLPPRLRNDYDMHVNYDKDFNEKMEPYREILISETLKDQAKRYEKEEDERLRLEEHRLLKGQYPNNIPLPPNDIPPPPDLDETTMTPILEIQKEFLEKKVQETRKLSVIENINSFFAKMFG